MHMFFLFVALLLLPLTAFGQTVFFKADAESGKVVPPWHSTGGGGTITTSTLQKHAGTRSYLTQLTQPELSGQENTQALMVIKPKKQEAYYSYWGYIDAGVNEPKFGTQFEWKGDISSAGSGAGVKSQLRVVDKGRGSRELIISISGAGMTKAEWESIGLGTLYQLARPDNLGEFMWGTNPTSPGAAAVPFRQWYHVEVFMRTSTSNGIFKVWLNGTPLWNLSHSKLNTLTCLTGCAKVFNREFLHWGVGLYQFPTSTGLQRMYIDDAMVTNYRVSANLKPSSLTAPANLRVVDALQ